MNTKTTDEELIDKLISLVRNGAGDNHINLTTLQRTLKRKLELLNRYKQSLESLTPGGSEFVDDPERCAEVVRSIRESQHREIVRLHMKLKEELK